MSLAVRLLIFAISGFLLMFGVTGLGMRAQAIAEGKRPHGLVMMAYGIALALGATGVVKVVRRSTY